MKLALSILSTAFIVASPWVLYVTLSQQRVDLAALALVIWVGLRAIVIVASAEPAQRRAALQLPAIALVFAVLGLVSHEQVFLLILPSATQAAFGVTFLRSLATPVPLVEHFARMVKPELGDGERAHCRQWTRIWGIYLWVLAAIGLVLAATASLAVWTAYVGVVSYGLVGALFAVEYVQRKVRFRDYGRNPLDWVLRKLFPAGPSS
jgi:uncharacterized membrane protein